MPEQTNNMASGAGKEKNTNRNNDHENSLKLAFQNPLASLLAGVRFLTILPVSWKSEEDGRFFQASLIWFPFIGLLIGTMTALLVSLFVTVLPSTLTAVLAMALLAGISGCLHLDGLADSGDGLLSGR
ncbi:MAG: adenosylcobinamide-GDP ribazoletransferase, partial [Thermodesulfobacteriota bacterium]|nr:adenosylcobinamide-GDP ribazoletransferase [Thermodesulfobacteriota bacterium]